MVKTAANTISDFNAMHFCSEDVLFVRQLRDEGLTDEYIAAVIEILDNICPGCFDQSETCRCWDDE